MKFAKKITTSWLFCFTSFLFVVRYTVCIRPELGYCCVQYQVCGDQTLPFSLAAGDMATAIAMKSSFDCNTLDYVQIDGQLKPIFKQLAIPGLFFFIFNSLEYFTSLSWIFADDWIWTADLYVFSILNMLKKTYRYRYNYNHTSLVSLPLVWSGFESYSKLKHVFDYTLITGITKAL